MNIKIPIIFAAIVTMLGPQVGAQTNDLNMNSVLAKTNEFRTVLITNWVDAPAYYRTVSNTMYNPKASVLWGEVAYLCTTGGKRSEYQYPFLKVVNIGKKISITCDVYVYVSENGVPPIRGVNTGINNFGDYVKTIEIYNYPKRDTVTTGEILGSCIAMRVENWHADGISLETYDCGLPCTNKIPVVRRVKEKVKP